MKSKLKQKLRFRCQMCICLIITGLILCGITAFPIETELSILVQHSVADSLMGNWLNSIYQAIRFTNQHYPYLNYGTDWLAFAHLILAFLFVGPLINPVKNIWVIQFGIVSAIFDLPAGFYRGQHQRNTHLLAIDRLLIRSAYHYHFITLL